MVPTPRHELASFLLCVLLRWMHLLVCMPILLVTCVYYVPCVFATRMPNLQSDSKVRYITSLKRGDMGIRGKIH